METPQAEPTPFDLIMPRPAEASSTAGSFTFTPDTSISVAPNDDALLALAGYLAERLRPATGYALAVQPSTGAPTGGQITLALADDASLGEEGYLLTITPETVTLSAQHPAGIFYGVQSLRQLLPPAIESATVQDGPWSLPAGMIRDRPRFAWRGAMLDVARHFFSVTDVKRYIDLLAYYKLNRLHLHLADDQGWRIWIDSWPNLAVHGGSSQVGGGAGGYYTQAEYSKLVAYAAQQYVMIIPEIDMPGHTNAALASYPELNRDAIAPPLYAGTEVGFSSLTLDQPSTFSFVDDVIRELAALTPGPYLHIGGDEASSTAHDDYLQFITRFQAIVQAHGKRMVGWEEISQADLLPSSIVQWWHKPIVGRAAQQGAQVIMSPASRTYLDMKYDQATTLGLVWAGYVSLEQAYSWDPATQLEDVPESVILGVEAPLWSETLETIRDIEYMAFPRLIGHAEIGWSPAARRDWASYCQRLGRHGARLHALGINFYRAAEIDWA